MERTTGEQILLASSMRSISGIWKKTRYHGQEHWERHFPEAFRHGPVLWPACCMPKLMAAWVICINYCDQGSIANVIPPSAFSSGFFLPLNGTTLSSWPAACELIKNWVGLESSFFFFLGSPSPSAVFYCTLNLGTWEACRHPSASLLPTPVS